MKTRNGFVSKSSTSSFLIYGMEVTSSMREKLEEKYDDEIYEVMEKEGIDFLTETDYGDVAGISYTAMGEDETPRQFKQKVATKLEELFGEPVKCELMEGTYPC
jgi:hypothetical protein